MAAPWPHDNRMTRERQVSASHENDEPEPQGSCRRSSAWTAPPHGGVGHVLFFCPFVGVVGMAVRRRSLFLRAVDGQPTVRRERSTRLGHTRSRWKMDQTSKFCPQCQKQTLWARPGTNHMLHLVMTLITLGFWLPIWLIACIRIGGWRCQSCGSDGFVEPPAQHASGYNGDNQELLIMGGIKGGLLGGSIAGILGLVLASGSSAALATAIVVAICGLVAGAAIGAYCEAYGV